MTPSLFLSHNSNDKEFVRKLARDLEAQGIHCWIDEAEIRIGESLIRKICEAIDRVDFLAVILSPNSVASAWVREEIELAMNQQIDGRQIKILPLLYQKCDLPGFLRGKKYADFTHHSRYESQLKELVRSMGVVFSSSAHIGSRPSSNLSRSAVKAATAGQAILSRPFHRPHQYIGMSVAQAAQAVSGKPNNVGNIIVENDDCRMLLEAEGNFICFVEVELKRTAPHSTSEGFDPERVLGSFSISLSELEHDSSSNACHKFFDHTRKLQVTVLCEYDGAPLSAAFSSKYYGM